MPTKSKNSDFLEKLVAHFYDNESALAEAFSKPEIQRILRLRALQQERLKNPLMPDKMRVEWLKQRFSIGDSQAWKDCQEVRIVNGTLEMDERMLKYGVVQTTIEAINIAKENNDANGVARNTANLIKIFHWDKNEPERIDPEKMYPARMEPTNDVTVLGLKPLTQEERKKALALRERNRRDKDITYAEEIREPDPIAEGKLRIDKKLTS